MWKRSPPLVGAGLVALSLLLPAGAAAQVNQVLNALQAVDAKLDTLVVPLKATSSAGGLCNSAAESVANPEIIIDSDGATDNFVVTSILIKTATPGVPATGFVHFTSITSRSTASCTTQ